MSDIIPVFHYKAIPMHDAPGLRHTITVREQIYRTIMRCGSAGATSAELADWLGFSYDIALLRTSELRERDRIRDSGRRRIHPTYDKCAIVWVLTSHFYSPVSEACYGKEEAIQPAI